MNETKKPLITTRKGQDRILIGGPQVSSRGKVVQPSAQNKVDIVLVIDTTGSMNDKIEALLTTCRRFVDEAKKLDLDPNFALISFGDIKVEGGGDRIDIVVTPTDNIERVKYGLIHIPRNNGFGNVGESSLEAIQEALNLKYRPDSVKVLILITDEPAHQHNITAAQMTATLRQREYLVFVIATEHQYYRDIARLTGGIWKEINANTSLNDILDIFRTMAKKVSEVAKDVHLIGQGSVAKYLQLKPPAKN